MCNISPFKSKVFERNLRNDVLLGFQKRGGFRGVLGVWLFVQVVELIPGGSRIRVRESTKQQYLDALAQYRLATNVRDEVDSFLRGLNELIPDNLLSIFDENELEVSRFQNQRDA